MEGEKIDIFLKDALIKFIRICQDEEGKQYYIEMDKQKIKISPVDNWFRRNYIVK